MPRSRNIKPAFFANDILAGLDPLTRLLLIGIWTIADKAGRLEDRPRRIKAEVLPYDECDIEPMLAALAEVGLILRYDANGIRAIQVANWDKDQKPHCKEAESAIPAPCSSGARADIGTLPASCLSGARTDTSTTLERGEQAASTEVAGLIPDSGLLIPDSREKTPRRRAPQVQSVARPEDVSEQTWGDWNGLRNSKRAPVTATVLAGARKEAAKAGMSLQQFLEIWCLRGSQSLQAEWLRSEDRSSIRPGSLKETFAERDERLARERWAQATGRRAPDNNVIDLMPPALALGDA
jgi:hypothetical protein